jgi:putative exosortase-associated protein (TIGR04073 family)
MKKVFTAATALILALALVCTCFAFETDFDDLNKFDRNLPGWKFGRGVVNILIAPLELITQPTNNAIKGGYWGAYDGGAKGWIAGSTNGFIAGVGPGVYGAVKRATTGVLEILTFWKPEYGPTIDPEYGTRSLAWGKRDYFDTDPFWYTGPWR